MRMIGLIDHKNVRDLHDAGLDRLNAVPQTRWDDHDGGIGGSGDLEFRLTHSHSFHQHHVHSHGVQEKHCVEARNREPSQVSPCAHAPYEYPGVGGVAHHADAIAQDRASGEGAVGIQ